MRVLQITDSHLFADHSDTLLGLDTGASFRSVVALAAREFPNPDVILATGDLAQDASPDAYRQLAEGLNQLQAPVYWIPGNHDRQAVARDNLTGPAFHHERSFVQGHWQVVLLDSTVPGQVHGRLERAELQRLASCLESHPDHHALVCLHHQPVPVGSRWLDALGLTNAEELMAVLERFPQVCGLLWGHVHQEYDGRQGAVRLLASPSTCLQFRPGSHDFAIDDAIPGYRWLELEDDGTIRTGVSRLQDFVYVPDKGAVGY